MFNWLHNLRVCNRFVLNSGLCKQVELGLDSHEIFDLAPLNDIIPFNDASRVWLASRA